MMDDPISALADLFRQAGTAHHAAFSATDGADPDWPDWYAAYLADKLPAHLGTTVSQDAISAALIRLDNQYKAEKPAADWAQYYAEKLLTEYR